MVISLASIGSALRIHEIMYDPQYNENYNEWIEIYNEGSGPVDLGNYTLCEKALFPGYIDREGATHDEQGLVLAAGAYALITDGGSGSEVYDNYNVGQSLALHVDAASICGGLANEGEAIILRGSNETIDEVTYSPDAEPGFSLEWRDGVFAPSALIDGTPGSANSEPPKNNSNNDPPSNHSEDPPEDKPPRNRSRPSRENVSAPSFVPLTEEISSVPRSEEKSKITLSSRTEVDTQEEIFITSEARMRQTVIYSFAGFCIVLTLLIVLKKV